MLWKWSGEAPEAFHPGRGGIPRRRRGTPPGLTPSDIALTVRRIRTSVRGVLEQAQGAAAEAPAVTAGRRNRMAKARFGARTMGRAHRRVAGG